MKGRDTRVFFMRLELEAAGMVVLGRRMCAVRLVVMGDVDD